MPKTVWIQKGNGGGIAGVWDHEPNDDERTDAYVAHLNLPQEQWAGTREWIRHNTSLAEYPVTTLPGCEDLKFISLVVSDPTSFENALSALLNYFNKDGEANTPDYDLAVYLDGCLKVFTHAIAASTARQLPVL